MGTRQFCVGTLCSDHVPTPFSAHHTMLQPGEGPTHHCCGATAPGVPVWNPAAFHFSWCVTLFLSGTRSVKGAPAPLCTHFCTSLFARGRVISGRRPRRTHFCASLFACGHVISGRRPRRTHFCASLFACKRFMGSHRPRRTHFCASLFARGRVISGRRPRRTHFCASLFARGRVISGRRPRRTHFGASLFARGRVISGRRPWGTHFCRVTEGKCSQVLVYAHPLGHHNNGAQAHQSAREGPQNNRS